MQLILDLDAAELEAVDPPAASAVVSQQAEAPRRLDNLTLVDGKSFLATTAGGDIAPASAGDVGLFHQDTRFLSQLELRINGRRPVVLSAGSRQNISSQIELTASSGGGHALDMPDSAIHVRREQVLARCLFDRVCLENYHPRPADMEVSYLLDADFLDVFQVRGTVRGVTGQYFRPLLRGAGLVFAYLGRDRVFRETWVSFDPAPEVIADRRAIFRFQLLPRERRRLGLTVETRAGEFPGAGRPAGVPRSTLAGYARAVQSRRQQHANWERNSTAFSSSNELFDECIGAAMCDFFSLRIAATADGSLGGDATCTPAANAAAQGAAAATGAVIAAGIPWFATVFGRDALIASYQSLVLHPRLAADTLRFLARWQGRALDDWRDEEPGKILHELREGEMTRTGETPHSPYYGALDSTPLFLIVLDETYAWTGDEALLAELLPAARRALEWIEGYGDRDGDGLFEYQRRSPRGLANQAWKDSWDAYLHRDGSTVASPIAPCEVQGYCYDALLRMSRLLRRSGDGAGADRLRHRARKLAHQFERRFWLPEERFYAMALDADKRPQRVIASNAGHLLWSRMLSAEHARQVADRLMHADMFSGWGVRTLASSEPTFNPLSYHRGSVWPHDNSLIAQGCAFYGLQRPLERIFTGLFQISAYTRDRRLPELLVGVARRQFDRPVNYPVACSPQAWASGAWFLLLTAALGLRPNAARHALRVVNPTLPDWMRWLRIEHLRVGAAHVSLEFNRQGERTFCNVLEVQGEPLRVSVDCTMPHA